ncbi:hypothetical protein BC830DRAFT_1137640 [Chytriomyces sp. MP71]|nr:hypothetical protein BC830DRAFT_1137640 [Chytriomyces sp. MP71]
MIQNRQRGATRRPTRTYGGQSTTKSHAVAHTPDIRDMFHLLSAPGSLQAQSRTSASLSLAPYVAPQQPHKPNALKTLSQIPLHPLPIPH